MSNITFVCICLLKASAASVLSGQRSFLPHPKLSGQRRRWVLSDGLGATGAGGGSITRISLTSFTIRCQTNRGCTVAHCALSANADTRTGSDRRGNLMPLGEQRARWPALDGHHLTVFACRTALSRSWLSSWSQWTSRESRPAFRSALYSGQRDGQRMASFDFSRSLRQGHVEQR